ncbi:hypothetical protein F0562_005017 [Nyssa sinensis]|uniref:C2H2-type domain-containing protein n=1 Tax=Nyssa sinensis TaxID=561372 RepID=A0A5J5AJE4_9ASTE|nr:hypothetical protein F0562_005017 [Nyssa sinensis]
MGHKRQKTHSGSIPPPPATRDASHVGVSPTIISADDLRQEQSKNEQIDSISCDPINIECKRALTAFRLGNHTEAVSIMKDVCHRHKASAIAHCVQGNVYFKLAKITDDHVMEQEHLKNAANSMKRAISLSPKSLKPSHFYCCVLYLMGNEMLMEEECKKGFSNYEGLDPIEESLLKYFEIDFKLEDIESMRKNSKLKRRDGEQNAMEVRSVQTKHPNEINKGKKMLEDRRTEIEIQVAAAKLLQRSENNEVRVFESSLGDHRLEQRRKNANTQKLVSSLTRIRKVLSYWKSMSVEEKRGLLEIKICDLRVYFSSLKESLAGQIFSEAIGFTEKNSTWKFWTCCSCDEKFIDTESLIRHLKGKHTGNLSQKLQSVVPIAINSNTFEMLLKIPWKPVDTPAAMRIFESQFRSKSHNFFEDYPQPTEGNEDCPVDDGKWPLSNDSERREILEEIRGIFQRLLRHEYLAQSHVRKVIECTMKELRTIVPPSLLLNSDLDKTPLCICFLGASQLKNVLNFLQEMAHACGLNRYSEKGSSTDDALNDNQGYEIKEKIVLTTDSSCLLLDEHLLYQGFGDADTRDGSATTTAVGDHEVGMLQDRDAFVYWLFANPSIGEELALWTSLQEHRKNQGILVLQVLEKEFHLLQCLCEKKSEHSRHEEALQMIESIYCEELGNSLQGAKYIPQSYGTLLRKRQEELVKSHECAVSSRSKVELEVISNILEEAQPASVELDVKSNILEEVQAINVNQQTEEETLIDVAFSLCNLKCSENIEDRMPDYLHLEEDRIKIAVQRQKEQLYVELCEIDARILWIVGQMKQLEIKLALLSAHDYRSIMFPLLKSFMLAHFEDLVDKDATEKSDAAREAFLAELALDDRKNINKGGNQTKHKQKMLKDKKKNKNKRKPKFSKDTSAQETLECERQIDNEAKQLQLAEQNKKVCGTIPAKLAERIPVVYFGREPVKPGKKVTVLYCGRIPVKVGETVPIIYSKPSDAGGPVIRSGLGYSDGWKSTDVSCSRPNQYVELDDPDVSQMIIGSECQIRRPDKDAPPPPPPSDATGPSTAVAASTSSSQPGDPGPSTSAPPQQPWTIQIGFTQVKKLSRRCGLSHFMARQKNCRLGIWRIGIWLYTLRNTNLPLCPTQITTPTDCISEAPKIRATESRAEVRVGDKWVA